MSENIHHELLRILEGEMALWIRARIGDLPDEAKFRANNALSALYWAGGISTLHSSLDRKYRFSVPATFCLSHALEEAVVAFVGCASVGEYKSLTDKFSIGNHRYKSALSWVITEITNLVSDEFALALTYSKDHDQIIARFVDEGKTNYAPASLKLLNMKNADGERTKSFVEDIYANYANEGAALRYLQDMANGRNILMYATGEGYLTGPDDMTYNLRELSKTTLGVLWATIDLWENKGERLQLVEIFLQTAVDLAKSASRLRNKEEQERKKAKGAAAGPGF
ncbi:hypothetical protein [Leisingera aquimarina]|uniref:hypothetical protein n=1 Tax=Leisingera aquimarina TaxID=476529 RepID=UPI0012EBD1F5|nr:hypothetical protein [Leisingera aquimarina]